MEIKRQSLNFQVLIVSLFAPAWLCNSAQLVQCPTLMVDNRQDKGRQDGFYVLVYSTIAHTEQKLILGFCNIHVPVAPSPFLLHLPENGDFFGPDEYHWISEDLFNIIPNDDQNCVKGDYSNFHLTNSTRTTVISLGIR